MIQCPDRTLASLPSASDGFHRLLDTGNWVLFLCYRCTPISPKRAPHQYLPGASMLPHPSRLRLVLTAAFAILGFSLGVSAQSRLSDKDIEALMNNLKNDAKSFRPQFDSVIHNSIIRKTSREKDAKALALNFENQTKGMSENFKKTKKADELPTVLNTSDQIDKLIDELKLNTLTSRWAKLRAELSQLSAAFGIPRPPQSAIGPPLMNGPSCTDAVGPEQAKRLVAECTQVSPATHPPCNAQNSCKLIIDEIKRSCALLGQTAPAFCSEYQ
jgi:hypothetical protein